MTNAHTDPLLTAVEALTKDRTIVLWLGHHEHEPTPCPGYHDPYGVDRCTDVDCPRQVCKLCGTPEGQDGSAGAEFHREVHPPLLQLLLEGTGKGTPQRSSETRIPIDADALELWGQVRDLIKLWCRQLDATFYGDDLLLSVKHWHLAHVNAHRSKKITDTIDLDVTRMVEGWVRMIETKFDPPEKREWKDACPAFVPVRNVDGDQIGTRRCGARRVVVNGEERFAISLNVTAMTATCARCNTTWVGERGIMDLRYQTNLWNMEKDEEEAERQAALAALASPDTPSAEVDANTHKVA